MTCIFFAASVNAGPKKRKTGIALTNTYDAFGKQIKGTTHHFGFSTVIEYRGKKILFDAGTDARIFEGNTRSLKVDLRDIDIAIVSHGHYDHIGGFDHLLRMNPKVKIYLPSDFFSLGAPTRFPFRDADTGAAAKLSKDQQYFRGEQVTDGMMTIPTGRFWRSNIEYLTAPKEVLPGVTVVPTTSKLMGTFNRYPPFDEKPMFVGMPELSLALATPQGEIVVTGCSHSGVETIVEEVRKVRKEKIALLVGGFHLIPYKRDHIDALARRMKNDHEVDAVAPAHCTGHLAFSIFQEMFGVKYRFFGLGERITL